MLSCIVFLLKSSHFEILLLRQIFVLGKKSYNDVALESIEGITFPSTEIHQKLPIKNH